MNKIYPLEKSPLYKIRNRKKLAILLGLPEEYFCISHEYQYNCFSKPKPTGGERHFTVPPKELMVIQKRLCRLLARIETPEWVISGKKYHSYITNAQRHIKSSFVKTMDISQFYDSVQRGKIYALFKNLFQMENDICWLMTELVTYNGTLPTGSPTSQLIVYWAYSKMFEQIKEIAFKVVTGVGIYNGELKILNSKKKQILDKYKECKAARNLYEIEKLNGMLCSLRQIDSDIFPEIYNFIKHFDKELKELSRNRYYRNGGVRCYTKVIG